MASEPQNDAEALLKRYAEARRKEAGAGPELHPATRRVLQGEVARVYGAGAGAKGREGKAAGGAQWWRAWLVSPQVGWALGLAMVSGVSFFALRAPKKGARELQEETAGTQSAADKAVAPGVGPAKDLPVLTVSPLGAASKDERVTISANPDAAGGMGGQDLRKRAKEDAVARDLVVAPAASLPAPAPVVTEVAPMRREMKSRAGTESSVNKPVPPTRPGSLPSPVPAMDALPPVTVAPVTASSAVPKPTVKTAEGRVAAEAEPRSLAAQTGSGAAGAGGRALAPTKAKESAVTESVYLNSLSVDNYARNQDGGGRDFGAANNIYAGPDVLNRFSLRQTGARLDFRDADGSSYTGQVVTLQTGTNVFRAAGVNRTLQQPVVFTGQLSQAVAPLATKQSTAQGTNAQVGLAEAQMRVQGQATVGKSNQIQVDAQRVAPGR